MLNWTKWPHSSWPVSDASSTVASPPTSVTCFTGPGKPWRQPQSSPKAALWTVTPTRGDRCSREYHAISLHTFDAKKRCPRTSIIMGYPWWWYWGVRDLQNPRWRYCTSLLKGRRTFKTPRYPMTLALKKKTMVGNWFGATERKFQHGYSVKRRALTFTLPIHVDGLEVDCFWLYTCRGQSSPVLTETKRFQLNVVNFMVLTVLFFLRIVTLINILDKQKKKKRSLQYFFDI